MFKINKKLVAGLSVIMMLFDYTPAFASFTNLSSGVSASSSVHQGQTSNPNLCARNAHGYLVYFTDEYLKEPIDINKSYAEQKSKFENSFSQKYPKDYSSYYGYNASGQYFLLDSDCSDAPGVWSYNTVAKKFYGGQLCDAGSDSLTLIKSSDGMGEGAYTYWVGKIKEEMLKSKGSGDITNGIRKFYEDYWVEGTTAQLGNFGVSTDYGKAMWATVLSRGSNLENYLNNTMLYRSWYNSLSPSEQASDENIAWMMASYMYVMMNTYYATWNSTSRGAISDMIRSLCTDEYVENGIIKSTPILVVEKTLVYQTNMQNWCVSASDAYNMLAGSDGYYNLENGTNASTKWNTESMLQYIDSKTGGCRDASIQSQFNRSANSMLGYSNASGSIRAVGTVGHTYSYDLHISDMTGCILTMCAAAGHLKPEPKPGRQDIYIEGELVKEVRTPTVSEEVPVNLEVRWKKDATPEQLIQGFDENLQNSDSMAPFMKDWLDLKKIHPEYTEDAKLFKIRATVERTNYGGAKLDSSDCILGSYNSEQVASFDDIKNLMISEKVGTYVDTSAKDIPLTGEVTLKYESHVWITWPGETEPKELTMDDGYAQITYKPLGENYVVYQSEPQAYSEVKNNEPKHEDFEAMAGTPTTRQLYVAFGGSEFIVEIQAQLKRTSSTRSFSDVYDTVDCDELCCCTCDDEDCPNCDHHPCHSSFSWSKTINYSYMEIKDVRVFRLDAGNIKGISSITGDVDSAIAGEGQEDDLNVFWHIASGNTAKGGRLRYSYNGNSPSSNSDSVKWRQDSSNSHDNYQEDNENTNKGHRAESMTVEVISDCVILQSSSGDQSVLYFEQPKITTNCSESTVNFPVIDIKQAWYGNDLSAGTWDEHEPNTIYYNGNFASPSTKFDASGSGIRISTTIDSGLEVDGNYILRPRNEIAPRPKSASDKEIYTNFNPKVTHPNGEVDPGESELTYKVILDENRGRSSSAYDIDYDVDEYDPYNTDWTSARVVEADMHVHAAYSDDHEKVNDIVIHNPVASQYAVVNALPSERDQRLGSSKYSLATSLNSLNAYSKLKDDYRNNIIYNGDFESKENDGMDFAIGWEIDDIDKYMTSTVHKVKSRTNGNKYLYLENRSSDIIKLTQNIPTDKYVRYKISYNIRTNGPVKAYLNEYNQAGELSKQHLLEEYTSVNGVKEYNIDFTSIQTTNLKLEFHIDSGSLLELDDVKLYKTHIKDGSEWKETFGFTPNYMTVKRIQKVHNPLYHNHTESGCGKIPKLSDGYDLVQAYAFLDSNGIRHYSTYENGHPDSDEYEEHDAIDLSSNITYHNCTMIGGMVYGYFDSNYYFKRIYTFTAEDVGIIYVDENSYTKDHENPSRYICTDINGIVYQDCYNKSKNPVRYDLRFNLLSTDIWDSSGEYIWSCGLEDTSASQTKDKWAYGPSNVKIENLPPADAYEEVSENDAINGTGTQNAEAGKFINLDYKFSITFENRGDFKGNNAYGIAETTKNRGKGYEDDMDTLEWTACKYVVFPFDVIHVVDGQDKTFLAGEPIMLDVHEDTFEFYCTMNNSEYISAAVQFVAVANNNQQIPSNYKTLINQRDDFSSNSGEANEYENYKVDMMNWGLRNVPGSAMSTILSFDENNRSTNRDRSSTKLKAKHSARKEYNIAVVGRIGNNSIEDTGDFRFANIFKKSTNGWLVDNVVPNVDLSYQNRIIGDSKDIRGEKINGEVTNYSSVFDFNKSDEYTQNFSTYGLEYQHNQMPIPYPLSPGLNKSLAGEGGIDALAKQPFRLGYPLYCDVQTIGNYEDGVTSIYPYYFGLDLEEYIRTGDLRSCLQPTDIYIKVGSSYKLINAYEKLNDDLSPKKSITNSAGETIQVYDNKVYLDWEKEHVRRNCIMKSGEISDGNIMPSPKFAFGIRGEEWQRTVGQKQGGQSVCYSWATTEKLSYYKDTVNKNELVDNDIYNSLDDSNSLPMDYPRGKYFIQGNNNILNLTGRCRTFMGTDYTYDRTTNPQDRIHSIDFVKHGQRWHYTVVLPDNAVMVKAGQECTPENIAKYKEKYQILVTGVSILAKGSVFTLVNDVDNNHVAKVVVNTDSGDKTININLKPFDDEPIKDPSGSEPPPIQIINIMTVSKNSRDDLDSSGTH